MRKSYFFELLLSVLFQSIFSDAEVFQFRAEDFYLEEDGMSWPSADENYLLQPVHTQDEDWDLPQYIADGIYFDNGVCSPLSFSEPEGQTTIRQIYAIITTSEIRDYATLFDAPCSVRLAPHNPLDGNIVSFCENQLTNLVSISVNQQKTISFTPSTEPFLLKITFPLSISPNEIYIGGTPASPLWNRSWCGGIMEFIACSEILLPDQENAVVRYLSLKYSLPVQTISSSNISETLLLLGVKSSDLFQTLFLIL